MAYGDVLQRRRGRVDCAYLEGKTDAQYILAHKPDAKIAVLYMNDDTKEAVKGLRDGLGSRADQLIVKELGYEVTDPTIDSQIVAFKASGADTFYNVSAPKSAAQAIRKANPDSAALEGKAAETRQFQT